MPDERWGEVVHAVVVPRADVTDAELHRHCRELIAGYKVPKAIELRAEPLPKSGAGQGAQARAAGAVLGGPPDDGGGR